MKRNITKLTTLSIILGSVALSPMLIHQKTNDEYAAISPTKEVMYNYPDIITTVESGNYSSISLVKVNGREQIYITGDHYGYGKNTDAVNITPDWLIDEKIVDIDGSWYNYALVTNDEADGSGQDRIWTYGMDGYGLNMDPENPGADHLDWVETTPEEWIGKDIKDVQLALGTGIAVISDGTSDEIWVWGLVPKSDKDSAEVTTREPIKLFDKDVVGADSITVEFVDNQEDGSESFVSVINWDDKDDTTSDQHVLCFGYNNYYNTTVENTDEQPYYTDWTIDGLDPNWTIEQLDVGHYTSSFIVNDGEYQHVYAVGQNSYGNFGNGSSSGTKYTTPTELFNTDPSDSELYLAAFAGYSSVEILDMDRSYGSSWIQAECIDAETGAKEEVVLAGGINRDGQLGLGNTSSNVANYTKVGGSIAGKEIYDVFAFAHESMIVTVEDGNKHVYGTGINNSGLFGNGTYNGSDYFKEIHFTGTEYEVVEEESLWLTFTIITILVFIVMIIVMLVLIHFEHKSGKEIEWLNSGKHKN